MQVSRQKKMSVVDLPDSKPLITGAKPRGYKVRQGGREEELLSAKMTTHANFSFAGRSASCSTSTARRPTPSLRPSSNGTSTTKWYDSTT